MAKNDFYKNFERFENAYRDFTSSTKRGAQDLAALAPISYLNATTSDATTTFYVELINTLFPLAGGAFVPAGELWKKLKDLAVVPNNAPAEQEKNAARAVANCMRVYYYNGNPDEKGDQLENQIQEFYKDVRPSAYLIPEYEDDVKTSGARADKNTERKHKRGLLRDCVGTDPVPSPTSKLMMILIDTPVIDMKLRGAEKVDAFMNYSPSILMSQCVPYLSAQFILNRKNIPNEQKKQSISMGQLKFLMGAEEIKDKSITSLMYDSSNSIKDFSKRLRIAERRMVSFSMSCMAISHALPKPTMPGTFNVPERMPLSWPPPSICAVTFTLGFFLLTYNAPTPLGPYILCAVKDNKSIPSASTSTGIFPTVWVASVCNKTPLLLVIAAISFIG